MKKEEIKADPYLSILSDEMIDNLTEKSGQISFKKGDFVVTQSKRPPEWMGKIRHGVVELLFSKGDDYVSLTTRSKGEWLGWFGLYPDRDAPFSIVSLTDLEIDTFPQQLIRETMQTNSRFAHMVAGAIINNIHLLYKNLVYDSVISPLEKVETFPFRKRVAEFMRLGGFTCKDTESIISVCKRMKESKVTAMIVVDSTGKMVGIITESDVVSAVINSENSDIKQISAADTMSKSMYKISEDSYMYQAMGLMVSKSVRHLPVVSKDRPVGLVAMRDIMMLRSRGALSLIAKIEEERQPHNLAHIRKEAIPIFRSMLDEFVPSLEISALISHINAKIHQQAVKLTLEGINKKPPIGFSIFLTGSHGREENHLRTDQDHGIIVEDYEVERHNEIEEFFIEFTEKFTEKLAIAGIPYCDGNVMCRNPVWRKSLSEWRAHVKLLVTDPDSIDIRYLTLLADIKPLYGIESYVHELHNYFVETLRENKPAVLGLYEEASTHRSPLTFFSRIITDKGKGHEDELDIKKSGLIFITESIRILAVMNGVKEIPTMERLAKLVEISFIDKDSAEFIESGFRMLYRFLLKEQLNKMKSNLPPDTYINVKRLSAKDTELLKTALNAVKRLQSILHNSFGNIFS